MVSWLKAVTVGCLAAGSAVAVETQPAKRLPPRAWEVAFATIGGRGYTPFYAYVITPHAVVVRGTVYCAFQDSRGRPIAMAYDIAGKTWAGPVQASDFGLGSDAHGSPSLYVDRRGHLHLFYGCHGLAMRHTRSVKPYDISAWEEQPSPTPRATYPQSMRLTDGTMYLFYRAGSHTEPWTMRTSADDGATWGEPTRIIEMRLKPPDRQAAAYAYFFPGTDGQTIHCFWNHKDDNAYLVNRGRLKQHPWRLLKYRGLQESVYRYNVYFIRRDPKGVWRNVAGEAVTLPVSKAEADARCRVYDSGDEFAYPSRLTADDANRPYIKFRTGVSDWSTGKVIVPMRDTFARAREGRWEVTDAMPADWPPSAAAVINARGPAAFGDTTAGEWFIFARMPEPIGAGLFLYSARTGYATRPGGPAALP